MKKRNKLMMLTLSMMLLIPLLTACGGEAKQNEQERVLRIGVLYGGGDEQYIRQEYTDIFEYMNGNISIEIVPAVDTSEYRYSDSAERGKRPDPTEEMRKQLTGANPVDVVILDRDSFQQFVRDGQLKQLDPLIQKDGFDTTDIIPSVMDTIKIIGDGNIYGLTPTFTSNALYYNKTLFKEAGVDLPTDNMTWDEAFELARRVANGEGKDRTYGFSFNQYRRGGNAFYNVANYAAPLQLRKYDDKAEKMTINTPQWEKVYDTIAKLSQDNIMPGRKDEDNGGSYGEGRYSPLDNDLFLSGKAAMILSYYSYTSDLFDANKNAGKIKNFQMPEWDVVTIPHHPEAPGISSGMRFDSIMAINTQAQNPDDAWKFVQFINGEDWAKIRSRSTYELVTRKSFIKPKEGMNYNIQSFYAMKPAPSNPVEDKLNREYRNLWMIDNSVYELFEKRIEGKLTTADMLKQWETKGNQLLPMIKKNDDEAVQKAVYGD
ncbi:extracellular solute-binding protein [Paenibacillus sp. MER TA 81-3]|uniref:ABC transporter substrate-binding protein n=1 Tax=Paenibacillus sp. MER TA 81-3 TaxID=2939573 RepID=UPI00203B5DF6|nr:extracellular solute-binding protein [Paenibacillus sp. MER TA 81-3]MCM3340018.1 extracellular solute-binding protein [Paenibacillus sp. MER TA 81-3]